MFRKVDDKEVEMVMVMHVDDILAHAKEQPAMKSFASELRKTFMWEDMGDIRFFVGVDPLKSE